LEVIQNLLKQGDKKVKLAIASRADLPIDMIVELALDYRLHMMNTLAQNTYISANVLHRLANHGTLRVRQMVARHPNTSQALLADAVSEPELRQFVAANPSAGKNLLNQLAQDSQHEVLEAIATNPNTPASVLKHIAETRSHDLLVAQHPNADGELLQQVLWRLAMDERLSVRQYVAKHPCTPIDILKMWVKKEPQLRGWIAQNPSITVDMIGVLARDASPKVRLAIAYNPSTPSSVLEKLSFDTEVEVRRAVANNAKTPGNVLEMLVKDWQCSTFVAQNPNTPTKVLEYLARLTGFNWLLLTHPNTSVEMRQALITTFAKSYIESDRLYAAQHPDTPTEILIELAKDRNLEIRSAALQALKKYSI
jgi:pentose-5-phosphate-3-epimerase